ncbi:MAG: Holliday junction branch migration protein RuvA [Cyanobacteria bacterium REEB65]|nr:Holliday junction branch migration protein RuvA [Cyanobacteria bacterium REEB65]
MIFSIRGNLAQKGPDFAVVEAAGVGYLVQCAARHLDRLGALGSEVRLLTHLVHREDAMILYGFETPADRELFLLLVGINGVGASKAMGLLHLGGAEVAEAIRLGDARKLAHAQGIGAKIAQRIVLELKPKLSGQRAVLPDELPCAIPAGLAEAELALLSLGYSELEARQALSALSEATPVEEAIRSAIVALSQG